MADIIPPVPPVPTLINAGCGSTKGRLPPLFADWHQLRIDINPEVEPDIVTSLTDLSAIPSGCAQAVWASHCIEHLFAHEVPAALSEFQRVLLEDGFVCIVVPDLQSIASWIASDRLYDTIYESPAGPVTAHDMFWGFGPAIERGQVAMAHRCGFTPMAIQHCLERVGFAEIVVRRRPTLELLALAFCQSPTEAGLRDRLISQLGF